MTQLALPTEVSAAEILRKKSLGDSISLCMELGGFEAKEIQADLKMDKAQMSRWLSGGEGIVWPKLQALMDRCGNNAPVLWMVAQCNYDLEAMRRLESETERRLRLAMEENVALRRALRVL